MFFSLDEEVKDINVNEPVEIIPVTEVNEEGEKRYALDDFETLNHLLIPKMKKQK